MTRNFRYFFVLVVFGVVLAACSSRPVDKLLGNWQFAGGIYVKPTDESKSADETEAQKRIVNQLKLPGMAGQIYSFADGGRWQLQQDGRLTEGVWSTPTDAEVKLMLEEAELNWQIKKITDDTLQVVENNGSCYTDLIFVRLKE